MLLFNGLVGGLLGPLAFWDRLLSKRLELGARVLPSLRFMTRHFFEVM